MFLVNFDSTVGSEIKKIRPAVVLQNDVANRFGSVTIVAAITSFEGDDLYPTEVKLEAGCGGLDRASVVLLNQLRTIDKQRLIRKLGALDAEMMERVETALLINLGIVE